MKKYATINGNVSHYLIGSPSANSLGVLREALTKVGKEALWEKFIYLTSISIFTDRYLLVEKDKMEVFKGEFLNDMYSVVSKSTSEEIFEDLLEYGMDQFLESLIKKCGIKM